MGPTFTTREGHNCDALVHGKTTTVVYKHLCIQIGIPGTMTMLGLTKRTLMGKLSHEGVELLISIQAFIVIKIQMMRNKVICVSATSIINYHKLFS